MKCLICMDSIAVEEPKIKFYNGPYICHKYHLECFKEYINNGNEIVYQETNIKCPRNPDCSCSITCSDLVRQFMQNSDIEGIDDAIKRIVRENLEKQRNQDGMQTISNEELFKRAMWSYCPNCNIATEDHTDVPDCCVLTCSGCKTKFCRLCRFYVTKEAAEACIIPARQSIGIMCSHETLVAEHIRRKHTMMGEEVESTFFTEEQILYEQRPEILYRLREVSNKISFMDKQKMLDNSEITETFKNIAKRYNYAEQFLQEVFLGNEKPISTKREIPNFVLNEPMQIPIPVPLPTPPEYDINAIQAEVIREKWSKIIDKSVLAWSISIIGDLAVMICMKDKVFGGIAIVHFFAPATIVYFGKEKMSEWMFEEQFEALSIITTSCVNSYYLYPYAKTASQAAIAKAKAAWQWIKSKKMLKDVSSVPIVIGAAAIPTAVVCGALYLKKKREMVA